MFLIIVHHFMAHGDLWMLPTSLNKVIVNGLMPFGKVAFDCFVAISCWFLVKSKFSGMRFMKIWLEVFFYNVVFAFLAYFLNAGQSVEKTTLLGSFFPIIGNSHGFASAYLAFYLLLPVLKKIQEGITREQTIYVLYVLGITQIILPFLSSITNYLQDLQSEFLLFVFVYFLAYYLQKWPIRFIQSKTVKIVLLTVLLLFIVGNNVLTLFCNQWIFGYIQIINSTEFSLFNIAAGLLACMIFESIKMPYSPIINTFASTTFGVLLFHDHNFFRSFVWKDFKTSFNYEALNPLAFITIVFAVSACIFILGSAIDIARQYSLEKWILKTPFAQKIAHLLDGVFASDSGSGLGPQENNSPERIVSE